MRGLESESKTEAEQKEPQRVQNGEEGLGQEFIQPSRALGGGTVGREVSPRKMRETAFCN